MYAAFPNWQASYALYKPISNILSTLSQIFIDLLVLLELILPNVTPQNNGFLCGCY